MARTARTGQQDCIAKGDNGDFPYTSTWRGGATHPAVIARSAVIDHVMPGSLGGAWLDEANLVTACWPCNERKGDLTLEQLQWQVRHIDESSWDGLTGFYRALWTIAGQPTAEAHREWLRALNVGAAR